MSDAHLTYDELETPHEMHTDCVAVEATLRLKRLLPPGVGPAQAAYVGGAARKIASRPMMVVSEAAARVAGKLNPFD